MIKTVSLAPPRASSTRSDAKAAGAAAPRQSRRSAASGSSPKPVSLSLSFEEESAPVALDVQIEKAKTYKLTDKPKAADKTQAAAKLKADVKALDTKTLAAKPSTGKAAKPAKASSITKVTKPARLAMPAPELKGTTVRAPKDLGTLYGGPVEERTPAALPIEAESPKKRLTREQREARKQLMKPDEGLLARLAKATHIPTIKPKSEPRGKGWRFLCGRCGNTSFFQTQAGLCGCGAIAIKD